MDPIGPWSAYQSAYNRISGANGFPSTEYHQLSTNSENTIPSASSPISNSSNGQFFHSTTTNQAVQISNTPTNSSSNFNPNGFLTPSSVGSYDSIIPPLFHPHPTKACAPHYRHSTMKTNPNEYHKDETLSEQSSWANSSSSFGVLPHETVTTDTSTTVEVPAETAPPPFHASHFFTSSYQQQPSSGPLLPPPTPIVPLPNSTPIDSSIHLAPINSIINNPQQLQTPQDQIYNQTVGKPHTNKQIHPFTKGITNYPERPNSLESQSSSQSSPISFTNMENSRQFNYINNNIYHNLNIKKPIAQNQTYSYLSNNNIVENDSSLYTNRIISNSDPLIPKKSLGEYLSPPSMLHHQQGLSTNISSNDINQNSFLNQQIQGDLNVNSKIYQEDNLQSHERSQNYYDSSENTPLLTKVVETSKLNHSKTHSKKRKFSENKGDDYISQFTPLIHKNEINSSNNQTQDGEVFYGECEKWNLSSEKQHHEGLNQRTQLFSQPSSQPPPYISSIPSNSNGTFSYPYPEISSQIHGQTQVTPSLKDSKNLLTLSSNQQENNSLPEPHSSIQLINKGSSPIKPPPPYPKEYNKLRSKSFRIPKSSMSRVIVPNIEKELHFLKTQEVNPPAKLSLDNKNNGFIDCYIKFLKEKNIETTFLIDSQKIANNEVSSNKDPSSIKSYSGSSKSDSTNEEETISTSSENEAKKFLKKHKKHQDLQPRRLLARRKAKEISEMQIKQLKMDEEEENDSSQSDYDPAWSPEAFSSDEGIPLGKRMRLNKCSPLTINKSPKKIEKPPIDETVIRKRGRGRPKRSTVNETQDLGNQNTQMKLEEPPSTFIEENSKVSLSPPPTSPSSRTSSPILSRFNKVDPFDFKSGEFVILKADLDKKDPPIWRIDGRSLLQKYESFKKNEEILYKNISTYSSWTQQSKSLYQKVDVRYRFQSRTETIVEYMPEGDDFPTKSITPEDSKALEYKMMEFLGYQNNFDIYIQTLISQALDSTFLLEVLQENDEYFLINVNEIDQAAALRLERVLMVAQWNRDSTLSIAVTTWPCYNILTELSESELKNNCASCTKNAERRIQLYGQPYNSDTLDGCTPDPRAFTEKDFLLCINCLQYLSLCNKVAHQKYRLYVECAKRVGEMRVDVLLKDTIILNNLLANEEWNTKIFKEVRKTWAEIDIMYEKYTNDKAKDN